MSNLLPVILFSFSTAITPGPNNFMVMNSGMRHGIKRSLPHFFGVCFGFPMMLFILSLGMGSVFVKYIWLQQALKIIGAIYMLYLSWKILSPYIDKNSNKALNPFSFFQAICFQWVNPKAWLMAVGAISIFSLSKNYLLNSVALSSLFFIACICSLAVWLLFGSLMQSLLKDEKKQRYFNIIMSILIVGSIVLIFLD